MNREEAAFRINLTQKQLEGKFGIQKKEENIEQSKMGIPSLFDISIQMPGDVTHEGKIGNIPKKNNCLK